MKKMIMLLLALAIILGASGAMAETYAPQNHWGASDIRLYLNNGAQKDGEWQVDSVTDSNRTTGYAAQFSQKEFNQIVPTTVETVVEGKSYRTTDRFYLPSGNYSNHQVLSRGEADISVNTAYHALSPDDVIPISYWAGHASIPVAWLRSGYNDNSALVSRRNDCTYPLRVEYREAFAPLFRVNLENVAFASCASAANPPMQSSSFAKIVSIPGSNAYGKKSADLLPDYGMYLKLKAPISFSVGGLRFDQMSTQLTIDYSNANPDYALVVCAYNGDHLEAGTIAYCATAPVSEISGSIGIDVKNWNLFSLDGFTIQVWLEEEGVGNLALATQPETFVGSSGSIRKPEASASNKPVFASNKRVFASRGDLSCSWGTLEYVNDLVGRKPSNQKIYYGKDSNDKPMEFWIADVTNNIMTLYQAKLTQSSAFKAGNTQVKNPDTSDDPDEGSGGEPGEGSGGEPGEGSGGEPGEGSGGEPGEGSGSEPGEGSGSEPGEGSGGEPGEGSSGEPGEPGVPEQPPVEVEMPQTGDNSSMALWLTLLGMAGAAMFMLHKRAHT